MAEPAGDRRVARLSEVMSVVFLVSGVAGLLFETLWFHQAGLTLGNSISASSLVLAGFMGGIGLGNLLVSRFGQRITAVVRAYAGVELVIAVTGVALVFVLPQLTPVFAPLHRELAGSPVLLNIVRFVIAFSLTLVPSTAMGMTLPLLVAALHRISPHFGVVLGRLYGMNTLGAVVGALAAELVLIEALGIRGTAFLAGALNVTAAIAAVVALRDIDEMVPQARSEKPAPYPRAARWLIAASFLAGAILLGLEVVWFRFTLLFAYGSSLGFALMLAVVLAGIGAGGLLASSILERRPDATRFLPAIAVASGIVTVLAYLAMVPVTRAIPLPWAWNQIIAYAVVLMLSTSLLSGILFTFVGSALDRERGSDEIGSAGALTFANTVGAMLGPIVAGFVLLPSVGVEASLQVFGALYGLVALLLFVALGGSTRRFAAALVAVVAVAVFVPRGLMDDFLELRLERYRGELVELRESVAGTLMYVERKQHGEHLGYRLATNSHSMSGTLYEGRRYMKLFVYLPVALHPQVEDALLISYGVGVTAKALTDTPEIGHIDVVDVSRDILELSRIVYPNPPDHPLEDPRVEVHIEDGRYFLETTTRKYDFITGEPPPPKNAGIVNLYTQEYFQLAYDRLKEGGLVSYWLPVHDLEETDSKAISKAFCAVFHDCTLWHGWGTDWILLGSRPETQRVTAKRFEAQWNVVGAEMRELGVERPQMLGALFIGDRRYLDSIAVDVEPLVDNYPKRLGVGLPGATHDIYYAWLDVERSRRDFESSDTIARLFPPELRETTPAWFRWQDIISKSELSQWENYEQRVAAAAEVLAQTTLVTLVVTTLGESPDSVRAAKLAFEKGSDEPEIRRSLGVAALAARDYATARQHFDAALAKSSDKGELEQLRELADCCPP